MHRRKRLRLFMIERPDALRNIALLMLVFSVVKLCSVVLDGKGYAPASTRIEKLPENSAVSDASTKKASVEASKLSPSNVGDTIYSLTLPVADGLSYADHSGLFDGELSADGIDVKNYSDYSPDYGRLLNSGIDLTDIGNDPLVLVIHTHSSEAYTMADGDEYEESDPYRTEDRSKSIIHVGDVLCARLSDAGIGVIHDRELYDYPSYTGSYSRSLESVLGWLEKYPGIKIILDIHRDAIEEADGSAYKTVASVNGRQCAQIMIVAGTDSSGLEHPEWEENLKLALKLQYAMDSIYPGLARPINLSQYRYNQDVSPGALIIEVGTNGNTLSEASDAIGYFADCLEEVIKNGRAN